MDQAVETLKKWVEESGNIVFFGGAGVSTESGIPDFRSVDGLYNQQWAYPPETILSHSFFERDPAEFYRFYRAKLVVKGARPNAAHLWLARMEREGKLKAVITQNIDGLHQAAGSREVLELHGSTLRCYCARCRKPYPVSFINDGAGVQRSVMYIRNADMLIIGGTSLAVYPAAGLINYYRGHKLVLVNRGVTPRDSEADLIVRGNIGEVFSRL